MQHIIIHNKSIFEKVYIFALISFSFEFEQTQN